MLSGFGSAARSHKRNSENQFWTHENHAIELIKYNFTCHKLGYIHKNQVRAGLVEKEEDCLYSSQRNYLRFPGLIEMDVMDI